MVALQWLKAHYMRMRLPTLHNSYNDRRISFIQDTLVPHLTEEEALKQFRQKFKEALQQSWKTSLNWSIHNMAKDNK